MNKTNNNGAETRQRPRQTWRTHRGPGAGTISAPEKPTPSAKASEGRPFMRSLRVPSSRHRHRPHHRRHRDLFTDDSGPMTRLVQGVFPGATSGPYRHCARVWRLLRGRVWRSGEDHSGAVQRRDSADSCARSIPSPRRCASPRPTFSPDWRWQSASRAVCLTLARKVSISSPG